MADSILRLKVESQEYDNKLKQATNGLTRYVDECRKVGGTLEVVEKETLDYVRALGQMDTTSRTATGKLAEMKKTFVELSAQYKQMTDEEKASPFGKALAQSLDQLKGRIRESKTQLDDVNKSINGSGGLTGALDSLANKFGTNIQSLASWGTALAACKVGLDVAKDAFFASEATVDEWGRVMDSSKSLYEGFLTALNTGDISGYLSRIDSIVQAAREAYNELDRLGTMRTIQAPQMSAQQTENERLRMMIQTGRYIAPVDGRRASMQNGQILTPDQIQRIEKQLQNGMQKVVSLVGNEVSQTNKAIDAVYNRQAQELGMSLKEFRKGTSSMAEFDKRMAGYEQYQKWRSENYYTDNWGNRRVKEGNPYQEYSKWGTFRVDGDRYNDLVKLIQQRDQQAGQAYGMQSQAYRTMNRAEGVTLRQIMGGGSGGRSSSGGGSQVTSLANKSNEMQQNQTRINELTQQYVTLMAAASDAGKPLTDEQQKQTSEIQRQIVELEKRNGLLGLYQEQAQGRLLGVDIKTSGLSMTGGFTGFATPPSMSDVVRQRGGNLLDDKAMKAVNEGIRKEDPNKGFKKQLAVMDTMAGNIGNIMSGINKMGIELPQGLTALVEGTQSIISIITSIMTLVSIISSLTAIKSTPIVGWLLAEGGIVGGSRGKHPIHAATGTVVPGSNYSGDMVPAMLNSGELVLNRAQQGNLASQLEGGGMNNLQLEAIVTGEQLRFVLNTNSRRRGMGEYVTSTNV